MYKYVHVEENGPIQKVELHRPEVRNAFHPDMIGEITKIFKFISKNKSTRAVVLSGAGSSFCAGADLDWMKSMAKYSQAENVRDSQKLYEMFMVVRDCPVPVVGKIHGHAMGGALGLVSVCDMAVAMENTQFCFSEVKLGLSPAVISAFVKDKMYASDVQRYVLTAEVFSAQQACKSGLIQAVASNDRELEEQAEKWLESICSNGPQAVIATKKLLRQVRGLTTEAKLKSYTTRLIAALRVSKEGQEGLKSFFEKRKASWRSK